MPARSADDVRIEAYGGPRDHLRPLFELTDPGDPRHAEVKNRHSWLAGQLPRAAGRFLKTRTLRLLAANRSSWRQNKLPATY